MLSKSKFITGQQCHKSLWLTTKGFKPTNPPDEKICPFTDKSPIITKLPSMGAIVLKEASGTINFV